MRGDPRYVLADETSSSIMKVWTEYTVVELLRNGVTTFVEFGARAHVQQAMAKALEILGLRGYLGAGFNIGRWVGGEGGKLKRIADEQHGKMIFKEAVDFVTAIGGKLDGRAKGLLCPTGVEMCSLEQVMFERDLLSAAKVVKVQKALSLRSVFCGGCQTRLNLFKDKPGSKVKCPNCKNKVPVPGGDPKDPFAVGANALHVPIRDPASAGVLSAAYQRYTATPMPQWSTMRLESDEIVALVNVRVLAQALGVEPDALARRTGSGSFVDLYAQFLR